MDIKCFKAKLQSFEKQVQNWKWEHFHCCLRVSVKTAFPFLFATRILTDLHAQLSLKFSDLDTTKEELELFQNSFSSNVDALPGSLQLEVIELHSNDILKYKHKEEHLSNFCKLLGSEQLPYSIQFACRNISLFSIPTFVSKLFKMKNKEPRYRANLSGEHPEFLVY